MKSSSDRLSTLLSLKKKKLDKAINALSGKKASPEIGIKKLDEKKEEQRRVTNELRGSDLTDEGEDDLILYGRYLSRMRKELTQLSREVTGLQEHVEQAMNEVKAAFGIHGTVELLRDRRVESEIKEQVLEEQRQIDGDSCQRFSGRNANRDIF